MSTALTKTENAQLANGHEFGRDQLELLKRTICKDATDDEYGLFVQVCNRLGLDPFAKQIYFTKYAGKVTVIVSIDGYRLAAERTGKYEGQEGPLWCGDDGVWVDVWLPSTPPAAAKVGVWKKGARTPTWGVAKFKSYSTGQNLWKKMPENMIAKCFDEETEVLTDRGFQRFGAVTGRVLQVTPGGIAPCDAVPFSQEYAGQMVTLDSDDLNFCVTPNHDMITTAGKIEAGEMFERSRARPVFWIPRVTPGSPDDAPVDDVAVQLAAAFLADGYLRNGKPVIEVSRGYKIAALMEIGGHLRTRDRAAAGDRAVGKSGREIITRHDKVAFCYEPERIADLVGCEKKVNMATLLGLSRRQSRMFVDTLLTFDGSDNGRGVRRFYTSRDDHASAFEVAAVMAGYAVSVRRERFSDLSDRPNYQITVSDRDTIPVVRWGRAYNGKGGNTHGRTGLALTPNESGRVWCVSVPSGAIVVRRHGFSMLCGNCAEAMALRKAFPAELSGVYTREEMEQAGDVDDAIDVTSVEYAQAPVAGEFSAPPPQADISPDDLLIDLEHCRTLDEVRPLRKMVEQFKGDPEIYIDLRDKCIARYRALEAEQGSTS